MTDIVERLLNRAMAAMIIKDKPNLYYDAADEITRLREKNGKLRQALKALAKHCNEMEWSQNQDYYAMGEDGTPCLSQPLVNAYNLIEDDV